MIETGIQYTLTTPEGDLTLNPTNLTGEGFYVQNVSSGASLRVASSSRPQMHGSFYDDTYSDGISVGFDVFVVAQGESSRQTKHDELAKKLWSLMEGTGTLKWTPIDSGTGRQLREVRLLTRPRVGERAGLHKSFSFELGTPRATAESQTETTTNSVALTTSGGGLSFQLTFPLTFTPSGGGTLTATNGGTATAYPTYRVYGPITNPRIINSTASKTIRFSGTVSAGDYLEVDSFDRTVKLGGVTNRYDLVDIANTEWYGIAPGANSLRLAGSSFSAATQLRVLHRNAWA